LAVRQFVRQPTAIERGVFDGDPPTTTWSRRREGVDLAR
jgi:hypothetical protein